MVKIVVHNPKNRTDSLTGLPWALTPSMVVEPWPQDVYYMDSESAKKFLDDNIPRIISIKELN